MAVVIQPKTGGQSQRPAGREVPADDGRQIMRGLVETEAVTITQTAIHLDTRDEIFPTEAATPGGSFESQRPADPGSVAKLPGMATGQRLGCQRVEREIPSLPGCRQQQLKLQFVIVPLAQNGICGRGIGFDVVAFDFLHDLVGIANLFVFHVEHGIDHVLALEDAEAIFHPEPGENGAVAERALSVQVELSRPPGRCSVFQLEPIGHEVSASALCRKIGERFDLEAARFLKIVVVGHKVWAFLSISGHDEAGGKNN